jgi:geranylgeranyl diphosphate synthase type I
MLAEGGPELLGRLERLGEYLGVLFQIRDDELGLFGAERELGKPVGSDIREGKMTLYLAELKKRAEPETRMRLERIFGNRSIGEPEIAFVREKLERLGARRQVEVLASEYDREARGLIDRLPEGAGGERRVLTELLKYIRERTR